MQSATDFWVYLNIIRKRLWLIGLLFLVTVGVILAITYTAKPRYRATVRLQVLATDSSDIALFTTARSTTTADQVLQAENDFIRALKSGFVAWQTIADLNLDVGAPDLLSGLSFAVEGDFIVVTVESDDPGRAEGIATRQVDNALTYYRSVRATPSRVFKDFVTELLVGQKQSVDQAEQAFVALKRAHHLDSVKQETQALQELIRELESERDQGIIERERAAIYAETYRDEQSKAQDVADELAADVDEEGVMISPSSFQYYQDQARRHEATALQYEAAHEGHVKAVELYDQMIAVRVQEMDALLDLSSQYNALETDLTRAKSTYSFLWDKQNEAGLKQLQAERTGLYSDHRAGAQARRAGAVQDGAVGGCRRCGEHPGGLFAVVRDRVFQRPVPHVQKAARALIAQSTRCAQQCVGCHRNPMSIQRILYVDLAPTVGGSIISLYYLVKGLARERYAPHVVLRTGNPYAARFRALGAMVSLVGAPGNTNRIDDRPAVARARHGRAASWLKRSTMGAALVHGVGFYARQYPAVRREAAEIAEVMRAWQPHLAHLNDIIGVTRPGILAAKRVDVPAICHLRALDTRTFYDRWLSRSLRGYICISQAVDRHQRSLGGRTEPAWIVYNGLDLADIDQPVDATQVRAELGLHSDDQVVGCVGRLVPWKGQELFLRALALLSPQRPHLRGVLVGAPEGNTAAYVQQLHALAGELGIAERLIWTGYRDDVPRLLHALDLLVHTSIAPEPFGRVLIEAMAAGVVVIGADAGAVPEIITDGVNGLTVPPGDADALASAMARVLDQPDEAAAWRRAARATVEQRFTLEAYVRGVERVYEEILG